MSTNHFRDAVAAYLRERPRQWVDGRTLATIGGAYGWRSRVSDARRDLGMDIRNRQRKVATYRVSEYAYFPPVEPQQADLFGKETAA